MPCEWCIILIQCVNFTLGLRLYGSQMSLGLRESSWNDMKRELLFVFVLMKPQFGLIFCVFVSGYNKGFEREIKRNCGTRARARTNDRSAFSLQLWRLWEDLYWCWCFEEAFTHPWGKTICLSLWGLWKGIIFNVYDVFPSLLLSL